MTYMKRTALGFVAVAALALAPTAFAADVFINGTRTFVPIPRILLPPPFLLPPGVHYDDRNSYRGRENRYDDRYDRGRGHDNRRDYRDSYRDHYYNDRRQSDRERSYRDRDQRHDHGRNYDRHRDGNRGQYRD